ncbi:hypothetical protein, partial [Pseudomonas juntendi]|uniref:hypothetical protein n=1 Tax=Pseudomonas juntendi TaxID=2666183 RepID=UPI0030164E56
PQGSQQGWQVFVRRYAAPETSSAARAAHRELRSLLRFFRANYAWGICARTPWRMPQYRVV